MDVCFVLVVKLRNEKGDMNKESSCLFKNLLYIYACIIFMVQVENLDIPSVCSIVWVDKTLVCTFPLVFTGPTRHCLQKDIMGVSRELVCAPKSFQICV